MQTKFEQQMKKGVLSMLILKLLEHEEKYGYQLISELRARGGEQFALKEGTLYPILYRLEDDGWISSRWSAPSGREPSRKYYAITDAGRQTLCEMYRLWTSFNAGVKDIMEGLI